MNLPGTMRENFSNGYRRCHWCFRPITPGEPYILQPGTKNPSRVYIPYSNMCRICSKLSTQVLVAAFSPPSSSLRFPTKRILQQVNRLRLRRVINVDLSILNKKRWKHGFIIKNDRVYYYDNKKILVRIRTLPKVKKSGILDSTTILFKRPTALDIAEDILRGEVGKLHDRI